MMSNTKKDNARQISAHYKKDGRIKNENKRSQIK